MMAPGTGRKRLRDELSVPSPGRGCVAKRAWQPLAEGVSPGARRPRCLATAREEAPPSRCANGFDPKLPLPHVLSSQSAWDSATADASGFSRRAGTRRSEKRATEMRARNSPDPPDNWEESACRKATTGSLTATQRPPPPKRTPQSPPGARPPNVKPREHTRALPRRLAIPPIGSSNQN